MTMAKTTISSRELNQDVGRAKKAARSGPVVITDRGEPAFVLTTHNEYQRLAKKNRVSLLDALSKTDSGVELQVADGLFYQKIVRFD
jgi:prevent-host-death family protein